MHKFSLRSIGLLFCDLAAIAFIYILIVHWKINGTILIAFHFYFSYLVFLIIPINLYVFDLYYPYKRFFPVKTAIDIFLVLCLSAVLLAFVAYTDRSFLISRRIFYLTFFSLFPVILLIRLIYDKIFSSMLMEKRVLILGSEPLAYEIIRTILAVPHSGMKIIGIVADEKIEGEAPASIPILGISKDLFSIIDQFKIESLVLAFSSDHEKNWNFGKIYMVRQSIQLISAGPLLENLTGKTPYRLLGSHFLLTLAAQTKKNNYLKTKRLMDVMACLFLLILLSPVLLLAMTVLFFCGPENVFFVQERIGKDGVPFKLIKLRSMTIKGKGNPTITAFGRWLRKYRIDEIPQLINVIKGEMSLIGPRPEIAYFVDRSRQKIPFFDVIFAIKPGLTGWAQVKFYHVTSPKDYEEKFEYNLYYLKNLSLALDLSILFQTIRTVLFGRGR